MKRFLFLAALLYTTSAHAFANDVIRSYTVVRASAVLTTSYVGSAAVDTRYSNQMLCYVNVTIGSLTSVEIKPQYSFDKSTWYDEGLLNTAAGTTSSDEFISPLRSNVYQVLATSTKTIAVPNLGKYMRIAIKGTGTVTNSLAEVDCYSGAI